MLSASVALWFGSLGIDVKWVLSQD
jgi:hypothetical protein